MKHLCATPNTCSLIKAIHEHLLHLSVISQRIRARPPSHNSRKRHDSATREKIRMPVRHCRLCWIHSIGSWRRYNLLGVKLPVRPVVTCLSAEATLPLLLDVNHRHIAIDCRCRNWRDCCHFEIDYDLRKEHRYDLTQLPYLSSYYSIFQLDINDRKYV